MSIYQRYGLRLMAAFGIFAVFQVTTAEDTDMLLTWNREDQTYLLFVVSVVLIIWEISDRLINYCDKALLCKRYSIGKLVYIFWIDTLILLPFLFAANYFSVYYLKEWLDCPPVDPVTVFWKDSMQSVLMSWLVITHQLLHINFKHVKQAENQNALMQKELLLSKYETLKNQVNPHFLFNSFSVLSSLIHENPDMASRFLDQLSKMYRYMLDNRDNQMVSLKKELEFMDSYIFLLKARHEDGLNITVDLTLDKDMYFIPTLSLQMLIENAIKHNKFSRDNPLSIRIFNEDDYLVVQNELKAIKSEVQSTKVGLENIKKRYNYQSEKRVIITESDSYFTVKLPILTSMQFS